MLEYLFDMFSSVQQPYRGWEAAAKTAEGPMLHHGQTHSFAIKRGEAMEGGKDILLNKHGISASRKAPF